MTAKQILAGAEGVPNQRSQDGPPVPPRWALPFELRRWQLDALAAWEEAGRRGVVEAATGTGKTAVALAAAERLYEQHGPNLYVVVVVPTQALARQWVEAFRTTMRVPDDKIGELHAGKNKLAFGKGQLVLVTVINTARGKLPGQVAGWVRSGRKVLVVIDECHRAGTESNAVVLDTDAQYSMGLSATPERPDRGHLELVYPGIGIPVYRYDLLRALDDGVLAPLRSVNLYVDFNANEQRRWNDNGRDLHQALVRLDGRYRGITSDPIRMWKQIADLARKDDPAAVAVTSLIAKRRKLVSGASERTRCISAIESWLVASDLRAIVFHEAIDAAEQISGELADLGASVSLDHSGLDDEVRKRGLSRFRRNATRILVAVRSLDEGIDIPDASVAVIAAGSRSRRQRIQRLGRILRASPGKQACSFTVLVRGTPEESLVGGADEVLLGRSRVVHHRWPGRSVADAADQRSSYIPSPTADDLAGALLVDSAAVALEWSASSRQTAPSTPGGYSTNVRRYSPNVWHAVSEVRMHSGMPPGEFDRIRDAIRAAYFGSLDETKRGDASLIYGIEVEAIRRRWDKVRLQR